jgi:Tfp pilus assembly protein PilN
MINLLPLEEKNILKSEEKWRLIVLVGILVLIFFLCLLLILYSIKIFVASEAEAQALVIETTGKEFENQETKDLKDKIASTNKNLSKLNDFFQESAHLTDVLEKVSDTLSPGMYLTNFTYQKQTTGQVKKLEVVLSGFAPNTDILFDFRKNLEKVFATKVDVGDSWIKPADFRFVFNVTLDQ